MESEPAPDPENPLSAPVSPEPLWELPPGLQLRYRAEPGLGLEEPPSFLARYHGWIIASTILLAGLLAHGLCVGSVFYLDDWNQVVANDWVDLGQWWEAGPHRLTYFTYWLTYAAEGISAPAFHAGNLGFHLLTALVVAGFARRFLEEGAEMPPARARRIGWWAGLIFAVHPLCSEVTNYVRARDIELATLFSLLAAWAALRWRRQRRPRLGWPVLTLLAILAATNCKEVGFILAAGMAALVGWGISRSPDARGHREVALPLPGKVTAVKTKLVATPKDASLVQGEWPVTLSLGLVAVCIALLAWPAWVTAYQAMHHPLLGWHTLTKARVFWLGMGRVLVPIRLCSDHLIPWTRGWNDPAAWLALTAQVAVVGWTGVLYLRRRGAERAVGVLLSLVLLAVLHRLAHPGPDLMVEYRVYPAMAPFCILLAWGVDRLTGLTGQENRRLAVAWGLMIVLVATGAILSARRAQTWQSTETLVADVLAQYPLQNRARKELQDADVRAEYWTETLKKQAAMRQTVGEIRDFDLRSTVRNYDLAPTVLTHIATEGNCALALARLGETRQAFVHLDWLRGSLPPGALDDPGNKAALLYARGRVEAVTHREEAAVHDFRESLQLAGRPETERALRRVEVGR